MWWDLRNVRRCSAEPEGLSLSSLCLGKGALLPGLDSPHRGHETFAFLVVLFTMNIFVTGSLLCFKGKGRLLPTPTLFQVKIRFKCHDASRQQSQKTGASPWREIPFIWISWADESKTRSCSSPRCDLVWAQSLLYVWLLQSLWSTRVSLFTNIYCEHHKYFDTVFFSL